MAISDTTPVSLIPVSVLELTSKPTWIVSGSDVKKCGVTVKENYAPSLERLEVCYMGLGDLNLTFTNLQSTYSTLDVRPLM